MRIGSDQMVDSYPLAAIKNIKFFFAKKYLAENGEKNHEMVNNHAKPTINADSERKKKKFFEWNKRICDIEDVLF